jgi:hypothetical protein
MPRPWLSLVGVLGGAGVVIAGLNAHDPRDALRAIAAGVGLLLGVVSVRLAELVALTLHIARSERSQQDRTEEERPPERQD